MVISILGILAALTVPALKNFGKSNVSIGATRQLLDDLGRARQLAISQRTTVFMVFVPTNFWAPTVYLNNNASGDYNKWWTDLSAAQQSAVTNLYDRQMSGYAFISYGRLGDQPGQHAWHYLSAWQNLPDGAFIAAQKFGIPGTIISSQATPMFQQWNQDYPHADNNVVYTFTNMISVPFPTETSSNVLFLPSIAFNYQGQLTFDPQNPSDFSTRDEYIPLAQGSIYPARDPQTKALVQASPDVREIPAGNSTNISYNMIHIDALTGRAVQEYFKIK